ncbi:MAG: NifB/NifX family molybdenum-iron cluster-binding protein [Candidatus Micrarchaeia archaeon]
MPDAKMMIVAICSDGKWPSCNVHPNFGRCAIFHFVKLEGESATLLKSVPNAFLDSNGAGVAAAGLVAENKAIAAVAGQFGPKASAALSKWGIRMVQSSGSASEALARLATESTTRA